MGKPKCPICSGKACLAATNRSTGKRKKRKSNGKDYTGKNYAD